MKELNAIFSFPTPTHVGASCLAGMRESLKDMGVRNPLVVTDPGLLETSAFALLRRCLEGQTHALFSGVHPNPVEADLKSARRAYAENQCDGIIAFGGGSALDVGKAVRLLIKRPDLQLAEYDWRADWSGLAPCVCVPTTAGTGSEAGRSSVITLESTRRKSVFFSPHLLADRVFLDPEITRDLPPRLTAATGLDALTHCIESFTSPVYQPYCDGVALEGVRMVVEWLPECVRNGRNLEARTHLLVAAAMGAIAFQKDLGAAHSMAHPLSTLCGVHHGTANALCLPAVMKFNAERKPGLYRRVGLACGLDNVKAGDADADRETIAFIARFIRSVGIEGTLKDYQVAESQIDRLSEEALIDDCHRTNPVPVSLEDFNNLYRDAL